MTSSLALYCKSYRTDLRRVTRLAHSIQQFNVEDIPFYVSVPPEDLAIFREHLSGLKVVLISDHEIIAANQRLDLSAVNSLSGYLSQQIIKSEFWRLNLAQSYMCLDSDAVFIRPFRHQDYLWEGAIPYTVLDEGQEFLSAALAAKKNHVVETFLMGATNVQALFDRQGRTYSFGPFPTLWHRAVWKSLDLYYLKPNNMTLMDAITQQPTESHWYGEALLRYKAIPLMPCQPLFKVYHYAWQRDKDIRANVGLDLLARLYSGVIYQSAWEREMDWPSEGGSWASHFGRRIRRKLGRI